MSVDLRKKLVQEIENKIANRKGTFDFGNLFDRGELRIDKAHFDSAIAEEISKTSHYKSGELEIVADPNKLVSWPEFTQKMRTKISAKGKSARIWKLDGPPIITPTSITWKYKRNLKSGTKTGKYPGNMEESFAKAAKASVKTFFSTLEIGDIIYSHGKTLPKDFKKGSIREQNLLQPGASARAFPGGEGTRSHMAILDATVETLGTKAAGIARKKGLYSRVLRVVDAKMQDLFSSTTRVTKRRSEKQIKDSFTYTGELILDPKLNPGKPDQEIIKEMKKFLELEADDFVEQVSKLVKMNRQSIYDLWSDSYNIVEATQAVGKGHLLTKLGKFDKRKVKTTKSGGLDMRVKVNQDLVKQMKDALKSGSGAQAKTAKAKNKSSSRDVVVAKGMAGTKLRSRRGRGKLDQVVGQNPLALATLINRALPEVVASKMTSPALNFRTGRFSQSAEVKNITVGPRGSTAIEYTYMKDPYQTFEPGNAQGSTYRDPRKIIGQSIRQIAQGIVGNKFLTTRRV